VVKTFLPCWMHRPKRAADYPSRCICLPAGICFWCGWQAVNAPLKGGLLTTTAAMGNWSIN